MTQDINLAGWTAALSDKYRSYPTWLFIWQPSWAA